MTNRNAEPSLVLNIDEVAAALKLCRATIRNMITAGELKSIKLRDRRVVRRTDLLAFLDRAAAA
jgi:excisionase family DNA binding protein